MSNAKRTLKWGGPYPATVIAVLSLVGGLFGALPAQGQTLEERVKQLEERVQDAEREARSEERAAIKWHLSGYFDAGFEVEEEDNDPEGSNNTFSPVSFNPIFHFMYRDWVLFQSELRFAMEEDGAVETELEYATVALMPRDRWAVVMGKFLSPIGQFQERIHPSWVNKLPTTPAGFEHHGGIQPLTDVGAQVRGGVPVMKNSLITYVAYVGNGPELTSHHGRIEVHHDAVSGTRDEKAYGGRFGILPIPHLEFGVSALVANKLTGADALTRPDYQLVGVDGAYTKGPWDVRFEYLQTDLDSFIDAQGDAAPDTDPSAWYVQVAYRIGKWEPVIRYGILEYEAWHENNNVLFERETKRATVGINYIWTPSLITKFAFETDSRDFKPSPAEDVDRFVFQVAYGF